MLTITSVILLGVTLLAAQEETLDVDKYYTWGLGTDYFATKIEPGEIVTDVKFIFQGITNVEDDPNSALYVHIINDPPKGFIANEDKDPNSNFFDLYGNTLISKSERTISKITRDPFPEKFPPYIDKKIGKEDFTYNLSEINDPNSWVWKVYKHPFVFHPNAEDPNEIVEFSSAVLTFIDYAGSGNSFGLGFDPTGKNGFVFDKLVLAVTIEKYEGIHEKRFVLLKVNRPPIIFK